MKKETKDAIIVICICTSILIILLFSGSSNSKTGRVLESLKVSRVYSEGAREEIKTEYTNHDEEALPEKEKEIIPIIISGIGDCTIGSDLSYGYHGSFVQEFDIQKDYSYFFSNVKPILEADDLTIANLESVLTTSTKRVDKSAFNRAFFFKGDPSYTKILQMGSIEAVNLANNHTFDYGQRGYEDTKVHLEHAGIKYFGYENKPVVEIKGIKIGLLGYNALGHQGESALRKLKGEIEKDIEKLRKEEAQLVIVSFHWGIERDLKPHPAQIDLGRFTLDAGADLILGHHPHVIQPIEEYNGKYIVYSLANFSFGGHRNPSDKDTFIFQQTFHFSHEGQFIENGSIKIIPVSVSSVSHRNDFRPTPVFGSKAEDILKRVKAEET